MESFAKINVVDQVNGKQISTGQYNVSENVEDLKKEITRLHGDRQEVLRTAGVDDSEIERANTISSNEMWKLHKDGSQELGEKLNRRLDVYNNAKKREDSLTEEEKLDLKKLEVLLRREGVLK